VRGITLESLEIETDGEIDPRGFLGIDPTVPPGYENLGYTSFPKTRSSGCRFLAFVCAASDDQVLPRVQLPCSAGEESSAQTLRRHRRSKEARQPLVCGRLAARAVDHSTTRVGLRVTGRDTL
jgi:hypothetical protein